VQFAEMYVLTAGVIGFGFVEVGGEYFEDELEIVIFVDDGGPGYAEVVVIGDVLVAEFPFGYYWILPEEFVLLD